MTTTETTTSEPGNTTTGSFNMRGRSFQFTFNEIDKAPKAIIHFKNLKTCDYGIASIEEAPTTSHKHIHLYVHMNQPYKIPRNILNLKAHIEVCRGSPKQNIDYIKKDGNILEEWGEEPHQGQRATIEELKEVDNPDELNWTQYNTWLKVHNNDIEIENMKKEVEVYYIQGPSGIGKTEKAKQIVRDNKDKYGTRITLAKYDGQFWHNVHSEGTILLYDDFRDSHMKASEFINLIDYNIQPMNIKGSTVLNNYKLILITSIQNINDIYHNLTGEPREQWMRRIKVINLGETDDLDIEI